VLRTLRRAECGAIRTELLWLTREREGSSALAMDCSIQNLIIMTSNE
jgi:hypothetical protein